MRDRVSRNIGLKFFEALVVIAASIAQFALLTRSLVPQEVGKFSLVFTWIFFLRSFACSHGIVSVTTRDLAQGNPAAGVFSSAVVLHSAVVLPLLAVATPLILFLPHIEAIRLPLLAGMWSTLLGVLIGMVVCLPSSKENLWPGVFTNLVGILGALLIVALTLPGAVRFDWPCVAAASAPLLSGLVALAIVRARECFSWVCVSWAKMRGILAEAYPFLVMVIATHLYVRIDVVMIEWFMGETAVAEYSSAYTVLDNLMILSNTVIGGLMPTLSRMAVEAGPEFKALYRRIILFLIKYFAPGALLIAFLSRTLLGALFGAHYELAAVTLQWLMLAALFAWMNGPSASVLMAHRRQSLYMWGTIISLAVNVIGNLILIPLVGYDGAAISTMLTELALCVWSWFMIHRTIGYVPFFCRVSV